MSSLAFLVRVLPLYALSLGLTGLGAIALGGRGGPGWLLPLAIMVLLTFAALITFRRTHAWPTLLLMVLALLAGMLLRLMLGQLVNAWPWALVASVVSPTLGIPFGWKAGIRLRGISVAAWAAAWVYILGWIAWQLLAKGSQMRLYWGIAGLLVFSVLIITWASSVPGREPQEPEGSVAAEMYLIGLNLGLAALMVAGR